MKIKVVRKSHPIFINTPYITLEAMLKLSGAVSTGGEAKLAIKDGQATVNGEVCLMRGKKLRAGDRVLFSNRLYEVKDEGQGS